MLLINKHIEESYCTSCGCFALVFTFECDVGSEVDAVQIMQTRVTELELERNRLKEQLNRLKQQMLSIQEDQEASIGWRIDAEVCNKINFLVSINSMNEIFLHLLAHQ